MGARTSPEAVKEIVQTSLTDAVVLTNHIDTANLLVTTHLVGTTPVIADPLLKKIELYLAAHFVALTEERGSLTRSKMGDADESFANIFEQGYKSTRYGQTALALDSTGTLARVSQTDLKAAFRIV